MSCSLIAERTRTLTLIRLVASRFEVRSHGPLWLALVVAAALVAALPVAGFLSDAASLRSVIGALHGDATVRVHQTGGLSAGAFDDFRQAAHRRAVNDLHGYLDVDATLAASRLFDISSHNGRPAGAARQDVLQFVAHDAIRDHAELVAGDWPTDGSGKDIPATLSQAAARQLPAAVGDRICVNDGVEDDAMCLVVTGIWREIDPGQAYWAADAALPLEAEVSEADLFRRVTAPEISYDAVAVLTPDSTAIDRGDPTQVAADLAGLAPALGGNQPGWRVETALDSALGAYRDRERVAGFALQLVAAQLWLLALASVAFLVALRLDQERLTIAVWRTRGWSRAQAASLLGLELVAVALLALPAGFALGSVAAAGLVGAEYSGPPLPALRAAGASLPVVLTAWALLCAVVTAQAVLAAHGGVLRARIASSRPRQPWWRRRRVAVLAAGLAVPVLAEAQALGSARLRAAGADQPYDLLLPGIGLALAAFAGVRLLPALARLATGAARRVEERLAGLQVRRAPAHHEALALLLTGTVALGVFAAAYAGTAVRNAADRAAYAAGADLRVEVGGDRPVDLQRLPAPGVVARTEVFRGYARPGSATAQVPVLGVDPWSFASTAWTRPGLTSRGMGELMRELATGERGGIVLPATATGLTVWVHGEHTGGTLAADLTDASEQPVHAAFGSLDFDGWRQLAAAFEPATTTYRPPLRLRRLTLLPVSTAGTIALARLAASDPGAAEAAMLQAFAGSSTLPNGIPLPNLWSVTDGARGTLLGLLRPDAEFPLDGAQSAHVYLSPAFVPVAIYPPDVGLVAQGRVVQAVSNQIPALVSASILDENRVKVGDPLSFIVDSTPVNTVVVGSIDYFPTLYGPGVVMPLDSLQQVLTVRGHQRPWPGEVWLKLRPGTAAAAAAALAAEPVVGNVVSAQELRARAEADPLVLAGRVNLALGFVAALALALAAFAIHFLLVGRARATDYAILQANGMSEAQVRRSLAVEQLLLLALSTGLGIGLGAVLAGVLLPSLQVSTSPQDTVPPTVLAVDLRLAAAAVGVLVAGCLLAGRLAARAAPARHVMAELRSLG